MLRRMIYNFIESNHALDISGRSLDKLISDSEQMIVQEFMEGIILTDKQDARSTILLLVPLVLRIEIDIFVLDLNDKISVCLVFSYNMSRVRLLYRNTKQK